MVDMTMGYDDRLLGAMEMPLHDFVPMSEGGDLPMHRVWYIRSGDSVLWDRRRKLDLVFGSGMTPVILAGGAQGASDEETMRRINEGIANVQRIAEEQQHQLDVQLHAQRHAEARAAGTLPGPSHTQGGVSTCGRDLYDAVAVRHGLILAVFRLCDEDGDGLLNEAEMRFFANQTGFEGGDEEWAEEFRLLCSEHSRAGTLGLDFILFEKLVNDVSESGIHCTDEELKLIEGDLRVFGKLVNDV